MSTPIRRQYLEIKRRYPHAILLFRLGDFYETFDDDARLVAEELDITLTSRPMGKNLRVPLAGIPHHALDAYLAKLIARGHRVAICEQMEDPGSAKGLVERQVVRVVTPGMVIEGDVLDDQTNNYLAAVAPPVCRRGRMEVEAPWERPDALAGLAYVDVSTGEFVVAQVPVADLGNELARIGAAELLLPAGVDAVPGMPGALVSQLPAHAFDADLADADLRAHFGVASLEAFGLRGMPRAVAAAGAVLQYVRDNQPTCLTYLKRLTPYFPAGHALVDANTLRHLEVFAAGRDGRREGSLLGTLDLTRTAMGARLLRRRLAHPLLDLDEIRARQDLVAFLSESSARRSRVEGILRRIPDLERLVGRIGSGLAQPRELVALRRGLELVPDLAAALESPDRAAAVDALASRLVPCSDVVAAIAQAIDDEPSASPDEGGIVRPGFSPELDSLRLLTRDVRRFLAELEAAERERTGIRSLRLGYNKVFGYYIEVSKANLALVPEDYERRQTLVGGERFVTPQLREYEAQILTAKERAAELETAVFRQVCAQVAGSAALVLATAAAVAEVDVAFALAEAADRYGYVRPQVGTENELFVRDGRHPMVERVLGPGAFVPNDVQLTADGARIIVLTGPNMAGKSTYLRQVALIVLMAQVGSFVPAAEARVGLVDRIFTRVGAGEDLAAGQSTFMVEMLETAAILHNATSRSLVVLDEIGRGTSTYDGMAIARAVVEYLHDAPGLRPRTLFATHYHELTDLAARLPAVRNFNVAVTEEQGRVVFLRRIVPGGADRSYGVHVAELAGLPRSVVQRARDVLAALERNGRGGLKGRRAVDAASQLPLFASRPDLVEEIAGLDVDSMTPLDAIRKLYELRERAKGES